MRTVLLLTLIGCGSSTPLAPTGAASPVPPPMLPLTASPFVPGETATLTVDGLAPGARALIIRASQEAPGRCFPAASLCLDIDGGEAYVGAAVADSSGVAEFSLTVPDTLAVGTEGYFQAILIDQGVATKTTPLHVVVEEGAYTLCNAAQEVFDANCTTCHGAAAFGGLDLRDATDAVGQSSPTVAMDWVDPAGSLDNSYLWRKIIGTHGAVAGGVGSSMPPTGALPAWERERVQDWVVAGGACVVSEPEEAPPFEPPPAASHRLTDAQYRNAVLDLFGVDYDGLLPPDLVLHGYDTVGAGVLSMSSSELETYETAAWAIAEAAVGTDPEALLGCPTAQPGCVRSWLADTTRRAWRLPANSDELDAIVEIHDNTPDPIVAAKAVVASVLLSPRFLFHIEVATTDGDWRRFTGWERAGRLGLFLLGSVPDEGLVQAADSGALDTLAGVQAQADRLLQTERGREVLSSWFGQSMDLPRLDTAEKDPSIGVLTDGLKEEMRDEYDALFRHFVFDAPQDFRGLMTTNLTMAGPELSALYGMPSGTGLRPLPDTERGGILGRAGLLSVQAHAADTSPTRRGKFVHTRVLCRSISPPPEGVVTSLEGVAVGASMRQRLEQHMGDPVCASCHSLMDPLGFAFEHYGPMGERRELDNGHAIDASGSLDGQTFSSAMELAQLVESHVEYSECVVRQMYRYAVGQREPISVDRAIEELDGEWGAAGHELRDLVVSLVSHDGFGKATPPLGGSCTVAEAGNVRPCAADCGDGVETCDGQNWSGCNARSGDWETCNGIDDDCDGQIDQGVERACDAIAGRGTQVCTNGAWEACETGPAVPETCNGWDDDLDGLVDENLDIELRNIHSSELPGCLPSDPHSTACREGAHGLCADSDCAVSGFGPAQYNPIDGTLDITCVADDVGTPLYASWATLAASHPDCDSSSFYAGSCNAAISRRCASQGYVSGFGPTSYDGNGAWYTCVNEGQGISAEYTELATYVSTCNGTTDRAGSSCADAIVDLCRTRGFESGFGPTENSQTTAYFVCIGDSGEPPIARPEVCNNWDDDLDGVVDNGLESGTISVPTASLPGCGGDPSALACREGAHAVCAASGCSASGFGPVEHNSLNQAYDVTCVGANTSAIRTESWGTLAASHPDCNNSNFYSGSCNAAISRRCRALGYVSGYGPTTYDGNGATYVCVNDAQYMGTTYSELMHYLPVCNGISDRVGLPCNAAINRYCSARGYAGGFGPAENSGDVANVTCVGSGSARVWPETCNGWDDDRDGAVDEGLAVELRTIPATLLPGCTPADPTSPACRTGAQAVCASSSCAITGVGPIRHDPWLNNVDIACLSGAAATQRTDSWATMAASHPDCNNSAFWQGSCNAAISRRCRALGHAGGFGPTAYDGNGASYTCVDDGQYIVSTFTELASYNAGCLWNDPVSASCADAISSSCESRGFESGYGPAEHNANEVHFICMGAN